MADNNSASLQPSAPEQDTAVATTEAAVQEAAEAEPPLKDSGKGKGKARAIDPEEEDDDDEDEDEDEDDDEDFDQDDLEEDLDGLLNEVNPSEIVPVTRQRSARSKPIDYSSAEAMQKAGLDPAATTAAQDGDRSDAIVEDDDDDDYKGDEDETMDDY